MAINTLQMPTAPASTFMRHAGKVAARLVDILRAYKNRRALAELAHLDERMLRDIGLTRGDLRDAIAEPLWRDPTNVLVTRANERRITRSRTPAVPSTFAPSLVPDTGSALFPARSRYY